MTTSTAVNVWDNVQSVSKCLLIAPDRNHAGGTLFLNGNHRLPFMLEVSFKLVDTAMGSPTNEDILAVLSWINYADGTPVPGDTLEIYDESNKDYSQDYNVYYNNNLYSEPVMQNVSDDDPVPIKLQAFVPNGLVKERQNFKLACKLSAVKSNGTTFTYTSNISGGTSFFINAIPRQRYGMDTANNKVMLKLIMDSDFMNLNVTWCDQETGTNRLDCYRLTIDHSDFHLYSVEDATVEPAKDALVTCRQTLACSFGTGNTSWYRVVSIGFSNVRVGEYQYKLRFDVSHHDDVFYKAEIADGRSIVQNEHEFLIFVPECDIKHQDDLQIQRNVNYFDFYDQYGNCGFVSLSDPEPLNNGTYPNTISIAAVTS